MAEPHDPEGDGDGEQAFLPEVIEMPVDGTLDLHLFHPRDVKPLVADYIDACLDKGITELRIVHGKGKGVQRRIVASILSKHPAVLDFRTGGHGAGGWGATLVTLKDPSE